MLLSLQQIPAEQYSALTAGQPGIGDQFQAMQAVLQSGGNPIQAIQAVLQSGGNLGEMLQAALQAGVIQLPGLPTWAPSSSQPDGTAFLDQQAQHLATAGANPPGSDALTYAQQSLASLAPYLQQNPGMVNDPFYGPRITALQNMVNAQQGGEGTDIMQGRGLSDQFRGGGDDIINGNNAATPLSGMEFLAGRDTIDGGAGRDTIYGDGADPNARGGNDYVTGGVGDHAADLVFLGGGDDVYAWRPGDGNDLVNFGTGNMDRLDLAGVTPSQLAAGLQLPPGVFLQEIPGNPFTFRFIDGIGRQVEGNGTFTLGGERLTFTGVDVLRLPFPGQVG